MRAELSTQHQKYYAANKKFPHILKYFPLAGFARRNIGARESILQEICVHVIHKMWSLVYAMCVCVLFV